MTTLRVAVVHNLPTGGARRRLAGTLTRLDASVREFTLSTASPVTTDPEIFRHQPWADAVSHVVRPPLRYADHARLVAAWARVGRAIEGWDPDVVFANPCRYLQGPPAVLVGRAPVLYYCDEARRATFDSDALARINPRTELLYRSLRRLRADVDRAVVARADRIVTNSAFSARIIEAAYGVECGVIGLGAEDIFVPTQSRGSPRHVLSVGTLIPTKGHDLAIDAVAASGVGLPLQIVAPRANDGEASRLRERATRRGVELRIDVGLSDVGLRERYWDALATLYLAHAEPFGLVSLESQAAGTPVIVANEGGLPSTVLSAASGVVVPRSGDAAGWALADIAAHSSDHRAVPIVPRWSDTADAVMGELEDLCRL